MVIPVVSRGIMYQMRTDWHSCQLGKKMVQARQRPGLTLWPCVLACRDQVDSLRSCQDRVSAFPSSSFDGTFLDSCQHLLVWMGPNQGKETAMSPTKSLPEKKVVCCTLSKMLKRIFSRMYVRMLVILGVLHVLPLLGHLGAPWTRRGNHWRWQLRDHSWEERLRQGWRLDPGGLRWGSTFFAGIGPWNCSL